MRLVESPIVANNGSGLLVVIDWSAMIAERTIDLMLKINQCMVCAKIRPEALRMLLTLKLLRLRPIF